MPEPAGGGHVLKKLPFRIAIHAFGSERGKLRVARAEVEIQPSVIVQIAEIAAHGQKDMVQMRRGGHVGESAVVVVVIKFGLCALVRQAEIIGGDIPDVLNEVTGDKNVLPPVIVVVEEPGGKAVLGFGDSRAPAHFAEPPLAGSIRPVVVKKQVGAVAN